MRGVNKRQNLSNNLTIKIRIFPLRKQTKKKLRSPRKFWLDQLKHLLNSNHWRCTPKLTIFFKHIKRLIYHLPIAVKKNIVSNFIMLQSQSAVLKLTMPFIPPHLMRSLTSPRISQRAEKLTTAHLSILVGLTIFWRKKIQLLENSNLFLWN